MWFYLAYNLNKSLIFCEEGEKKQEFPFLSRILAEKMFRREHLE